MRGAPVLAALTAALAAACSFTPVDVEPREALIRELPADVAPAATLPGTILVRETTAEAPYDTTRMAYGTRPTELAYFARHEWADRPAAMLHGLLVRTLERTHRFRAVAVPPHAGPAAYELDTRLVELRADFASDPAVVRLVVRVEMQRAADPHPGPLPRERVFASREFEAREPMSTRSPDAGAVAANAAAARILADIARFVVEKSG